MSEQVITDDDVQNANEYKNTLEEIKDVEWYCISDEDVERVMGYKGELEEIAKVEIPRITQNDLDLLEQYSVILDGVVENLDKVNKLKGQTQ